MVRLVSGLVYFRRNITGAARVDPLKLFEAKETGQFGTRDS